MNGKAIRSVATTHLFDRIGKHFGVEVLEVPVGFKYISQHILRDDIMIGADEAGGLSMLGHIPGKDGILACLLVAEVCAIEGKPLTTVLQEIMSEVGELYSSRIDLRFREVGRKEEILTRLKDEHPTYISGLKVVDSYDIDGMKYILGDGSWVMVRSSGTEPLLRVYLEGSGRDILRRLERFADELVK
jgi:phosphomannomutase